MRGEPVMTSTPEPAEIGLRARTIRRRRGLSLDVAAGLVGISKGYLSRLETGQRLPDRGAGGGVPQPHRRIPAGGQ